ncbi:MAG: hypothetical protein ACKOFZ_00040 [Ilumatobacteraceae bacterium]
MLHLVRRFFQSWSSRLPDDSETVPLRDLMTVDEFALWTSMAAPDQRHSLKVVERFRDRLVDATSAEIVGVALHDVGKVRSGLGTFGRVMATVVGPRTTRFRIYHDHERIGLQMLRECGSSLDVVAVLEGTAREAALAAFRWADDC